MGSRLILGLIGLVILIVFVQTFILGGDDELPTSQGRSEVAPTATMPAQLPSVIDLGESSTAGGTSTGATTGGGTYTVQSGDTLGSIAVALNVAPEAQADWIAEVLALNGIADARLLQVGQELILPTAQAGPEGTSAPEASAEPTATPSDAAAPSVTGGGGSYTVVEGDTPLGIAEKHCVEGADAWVNELLLLNNVDAGSLSVGQVLELPAGTPELCLPADGSLEPLPEATATPPI